MAFEISRLGCAEAGVSLCHGMILPATFCFLLQSMSYAMMLEGLGMFTRVFTWASGSLWLFRVCLEKACRVRYEAPCTPEPLEKQSDRQHDHCHHQIRYIPGLSPRH